MAIFRGTGGSGNSTDDSIVSAVTEQAGIATTKASEAASSATTATTKASEASASANTATTKASEASVSATSAENQKLLCIDLKNDTLDLAQDALASANAAEASAQTANNTHVQTVSGIATEVQNLDSIKTDITGVNTIKSDVTTVAGISSNVTTVAADASDIGTVATNIANVNNVGDNIANVNAVHSNASNINTVAADGTDIGTVASNISNVNTVAGISSDVTTVAGLESKMDTVIADASDIGAVAGNISDVTTVAGINADVDTVAGIAAKVTTVADNISDVQSADTNAANASASASQAANSASAASASATTASTKATEASNSATAASNSATTATTKATEAAGSATTATTKATEASTSATNAATSATTATTKASEAASSATSASGSATTATTKASEADASATSAASSATDSSNAASTWTNYYSTYLGAADAPPTADVQGNALQTGAFYYDTGAGSNTVGLYVYNGSSWVYSTNYNNVTAPYSLAQDLATNGNDISFGDNAKANFGASNDLQIWHDGSNSRIKDSGTGDLFIQGSTNVQIEDASGANMIFATSGGSVKLFHNALTKLETTSTGVDVTGTIKADNDLILGGADGTNAASIVGFAPYNWGGSSDDLISSIEMSPVVGTQDDGVIELKTANNINTGGTLKTRLKVDNLGDISFYEDTGTTPKFFWDASAERLGIGTNSPSALLHLQGAHPIIRLTDSDTGADSLISASSSTGALSISADNGNELNNSFINFKTDGSERMRIDSSGNVGIGTSNPVSIGGHTGVLTLHGDNATAIVLKDNVSRKDIRLDDGNLSVRNSAGESHLMVTDGGNVGIGTASPDSKVTVDGNLSFPEMSFKASNQTSRKLTIGMTDSTDHYISAVGSETKLLFKTQDTERMRIDSSGNVGIGTTSPSSALEVADSGVELRITDTRNQTFTVGDTIASLGFYSNDVSGSSGGANNLPRGAIDVVTTSTFGSTHDMVFRTRGDETADASEKVRITSTGKVGIGTTSPSATLEVNAGSFQAMKLRRGTSGTDANIITFAQGDGTSVGHIGGVGSGGLQLRTGSGNGTERMRIDSSGNVLVGTTTSTVGFNNAIEGVNLRSEGRIFASADQDYPLNLSRNTNDGDIAVFRKDGVPVGSIGTDSNSQLMIGSGDTGLSFQSNNDAIIPRNTSGAARSGLINLGTTGAQFKDLYLSKRVYSGNPSNTAGNLFLHIDGNADGVSTGYKIRSGVGVTTGSSHIAFVNPNGIVGQIRTDGSATSYNTSSDERLKQNIQDADDAGSKIDAIQVRQFDWIIDGTHESYGVIAQELQSVAPEAVSGNPESEEMMGVDYSKLVPTLIKEIQTLRNRVAQLENN